MVTGAAASVSMVGPSIHLSIAGGAYTKWGDHETSVKPGEVGLSVLGVVAMAVGAKAGMAL